MIWLLPHPLFPVSNLDRRHTGRRRKRDNFLTGRGEGRGGVGAKPYEGEKAWSSKNHSILSDLVNIERTVRFSLAVCKCVTLYCEH
jgi:hypothetical protein